MTDQLVQPNGALLGHADRPVVLVRRTLDATPGEVWDAWTDPDRLARWLGAVDGSLAATGSTVRIAMAATELHADPDEDDNPARFTVLEAAPPTGEVAGRLVFVFDDRADPGGIVTVTMAPEGDDRCRLVLQHALAPSATALEHSAGFGAGWEGFLDWLADALAGRDHGDDSLYEALLPAYAQQRDRLASVPAGELEERRDGSVVVRHRRTLDAPIEHVWSLLTTGNGLATWLGHLTEGTFGPDAEIAVVHASTSDGDMVQRSRITTWEPPNRLAMTWEFTDEPASRVEITLRSIERRTDLELVHHDLRAMPEEYLAGWHAHLDVLAAVAEGRPAPTWDEAFETARASSSPSA